ncbi:MAG: UDP-N-acetylenolpyruvoylglucosamine reductase, partial [Dolichospermum sp.]
MITSQELGKIYNFPNLTSQTLKDHEDNHKSIYLPGTDCSLRTHTSLSGFTSYRVGGEAEYYVSPQNLEALKASIEFAKEN